MGEELELTVSSGEVTAEFGCSKFEPPLTSRADIPYMLGYHRN